jgi:LacI family transcriptional regulator
MKMPTTHRIALLFKSNEIYGREIVEGVSQYLSTTRVSWDLFLETDFSTGLANIASWQGDGIIADFNDAPARSALMGIQTPLVAVGTGHADASMYPPGIPYVASNDGRLISLAYEHLVEVGLSRFALFSVPPAPDNPWAQEREREFRKLMQRDRLPVEIYRGTSRNAPTWSEEGSSLVEWLRALPKPIGIIAANDSRARQLLQACLIADIPVPAQVALIGVDNDPLARVLTRIPLSSVIQGTHEMGRTAARMLHQLLNGVRQPATQVMVEPVGVHVLASSRHEAAKHPYVMRAQHFIRQYACQGIKTEQVADYVGVSRSSLESHFRAELGRSVHDEVLRYKIDAATTILANDTTSIADVAVRCGFTSVQYMHAVFKRELDCTPRKYRDQALMQPKVAA